MNNHSADHFLIIRSDKIKTIRLELKVNWSDMPTGRQTGERETPLHRTTDRQSMHEKLSRLAEGKETDGEKDR